MNNYSVFDFVFINDPELEQEFYNFFTRYGLEPLFTREHQSTPIKVDYLDARSIVNENGKHHNLFKNFTDYLLIAQDNKSYEEAIFKIIYDARTFKGLANSIRRIMKFIDSIDGDHLFNTWNIVWYNKDVY